MGREQGRRKALAACCSGAGPTSLGDWSLLTLATLPFAQQGRLAANVPDCPPAHLSAWAAAAGNCFEEREQAVWLESAQDAWYCLCVTRRRSPGGSGQESGCGRSGWQSWSVGCRQREALGL